ncbi:MAG: methyltransferase domain-containing protein [Candidatus Promineifilaceae bacterium]|nr:methyltransferase domain-containing protein [Candidatus Promineifilaceae bacterium]
MSDAQSPQYWDNLYQANHFPWDLGRPTPVFVRLAENERLERGRMLVLGAGRGHDARLFARHGYEVTAVDFASEAVAHMRRQDDPRHPVEIVQADFFELPPGWTDRFDYVLDYTSFVAIPPERRPAYAEVVARLLKPGGCYIILAFPIGTRPGGPPYTVQPEFIIDLYRERGFDLVQRETPTDSVPGRRGHEELLMLRRKGAERQSD